MGSMGLIVVSCIPLLADYTIGSYNTTILGARYYYVHPVVYQLFELLVCPLYAVLLFSAALASVLFTREKTVPGIAKVLVSAGLGTVGFSVLRLLLFSAYEDHLVWSVFWEEATELLYILMVFWFLWLFYGSGDVLPGSIFKRFDALGSARRYARGQPLKRSFEVRKVMKRPSEVREDAVEASFFARPPQSFEEIPGGCF